MTEINYTINLNLHVTIIVSVLKDYNDYRPIPTTVS